MLDADMDAAVLEPFESEGAGTSGRSTGGSASGVGSWRGNRPTGWCSRWQIRPDFTPEPDPARASEVEVRFVAESPERTRVDLEHRALERHGDDWENMRAAVDSDQGWPYELQLFAAAAEAATD